MNEDALKAAESAFQTEAQCLSEAFRHIDRAEFTRAVDALARAPRIAASGCGHTGITCRHFAHLMCCIGRPAVFIPPSEASHGGAGFIQKGDVMLLASRGGKTAELMPILEICKIRGAAVIAVTEDVSSPLAAGADVVLKMYVTRETDRYNCQGTTSNTVLNVIFDALQAALILETGFSLEDFARVHPGGAVGERLKALS